MAKDIWPGVDKSHCLTPRASASLGQASGFFFLHNFMMDKLKSRSDKSFENLFVSPVGYLVGKGVLAVDGEV